MAAMAKRRHAQQTSSICSYSSVTLISAARGKATAADETLRIPARANAAFR